MTGQTPLLTPQGQELLSRLSGEDVAPQTALRLAESLRGSYPADLVAAALTQQALRAAARVKFGNASAMLFTRDGLEQASAEPAARHSAARYASARIVADLCCGIGGNLAALAAGHRVIAVDRDLVSLTYARHNATTARAKPGTAEPAVTEPATAKPATAEPATANTATAEPAIAERAATVPTVMEQVAAVCADVRTLTLAGVDAVYIDPARRAGGRRLRAGQSEPPLGWCLELAGLVPAVGIKAAPGLPHELVPAGWEIEFVAVGRDLKEAMLWSPALATAQRRATVLPGGQRQAGPAGQTKSAGPAGPAESAEPAGPVTMVAAPGPPPAVAPSGEFLLDPNPAVTRAGLVGELARDLGGWQIDPMIAFLSADVPLRSPFGRGLRVLHSAPWHEKRFARRLRELGIGAADIRRRGLAGDVGQIHRRLGLRGPGSAVLIMTRQADRPWGLICAPLADTA